MVRKLFISLLSISSITVASPLQEKLRLVANKTAEIKDNIRSGTYFSHKTCVGACSGCKSCKACGKCSSL